MVKVLDQKGLPDKNDVSAKTSCPCFIIHSRINLNKIISAGIKIVEPERTKVFTPKIISQLEYTKKRKYLSTISIKKSLKLEYSFLTSFYYKQLSNTRIIYTKAGDFPKKIENINCFRKVLDPFNAVKKIALTIGKRFFIIFKSIKKQIGKSPQSFDPNTVLLIIHYDNEKCFYNHWLYHITYRHSVFI